MIFSIIKLKKNKMPITKMVTLVEGSLLLIGIIWMIIRRIPVFKGFLPTPFALYTGLIAGVLLLASSGIFYLIDKSFFGGGIRGMMETSYYPIFKKITFGQILFLALASGFCEEFFFRGILMSEIGIIGSSVIFGLLHTPGKKTWFLGLWTAMIGVVFALLYKVTGNLFVPMVAHTLNNLVAVSFIRYVHFSGSKAEDKAEHEEDDDEYEEDDEEIFGKSPLTEKEEEMEETVEEIDELSREAVEVISRKMKVELKDVKDSLKELSVEARDIVQDLLDEFKPEQPEVKKTEPAKAASPVKLLDPSMVKDIVVREESLERMETPGKTEKIERKVPPADKDTASKKEVLPKKEVPSKKEESVKEVEAEEEPPPTESPLMIPEPDYGELHMEEEEDAAVSMLERIRSLPSIDDIMGKEDDSDEEASEEDEVDKAIRESVNKELEGIADEAADVLKKVEKTRNELKEKQNRDKAKAEKKAARKKKKQDRKNRKNTDSPKEVKASETTIPPDRRGDDVDDEGIGVVNKPQ